MVQVQDSPTTEQATVQISMLPNMQKARAHHVHLLQFIPNIGYEIFLIGLDPHTMVAGHSLH